MKAILLIPLFISGLSFACSLSLGLGDERVSVALENQRLAELEAFSGSLIEWDLLLSGRLTLAEEGRLLEKFGQPRDTRFLHGLDSLLELDDPATLSMVVTEDRIGRFGKWLTEENRRPGRTLSIAEVAGGVSVTELFRQPSRDQYLQRLQSSIQVQRQIVSVEEALEAHLGEGKLYRPLDANERREALRMVPVFPIIITPGVLGIRQIEKLDRQRLVLGLGSDAN